MAIPAINSRWYLLHHWTVPVWMERMDEILPLDGNNCERSRYWFRNLRDLLAVFQLPDKLVSHLVRFLSRSSELHATNNVSSAASVFAAKYHHSICRWTGIYAVFEANVQQPRGAMGWHSPWVAGVDHGSNLPCIHKDWSHPDSLRKKSKFAPTFGPGESITPEKEPRASV